MCVKSDIKKIREINFTKKIPASKLLSNEGLRAQMKAWKEDTVKTPSKFRTALVDCEKYMKISVKSHKFMNLCVFTEFFEKLL